MNEDFLGRLHEALDGAPPYALPAEVSRALEEAVGAKDVRLLLVDYSERSLEEVPARNGGEGEEDIEDAETLGPDRDRQIQAVSAVVGRDQGLLGAEDLAGRRAF